MEIQAREPRTQATVPLGVYRHQTFEHVYDNHSLYYNDLVAWYFLTGDRRVVDLLLPVAAFPGVGDETQVPGRSGAFTREFFVPFVAFLDAWEVIGHEDAVTDVLLADGPDYRLTSSRAAHLTNPSRQPELSLAAASAMARGIRSMYQSVVGFWTRNLAGSPHASAMTPDFSLIDPTFTPANHQEFLLLDTHVDPFPFQPAGTTSCRSDLLRNGVCIPASIPSVGPTEAVALLEHTVEAIHRYRELTGVDYTRYVLWHTAEYQHLFRNPFGSFIYKPFQQYERLHVNHSNTAAASAFEFAAWGDPLAAQRLDEATVSVDARIRILGRENAFMGTDNDLHPFLYAWRARWEGEGVTDGTAFDRIATTAVTVAANRLNLMPPFLYAHPDPITAPSPIPTSGPGMNWTLPRRVFWDTWWGLPAYEYISAPIFLATGADATVQVTALNELFGELVRTELSAGAIDPPFAHLWLSRANRVRGAASHDDNMAAGIGSIATSARDAVLCYELRRRSDTSYRNLCGPIDQTYP